MPARGPARRSCARAASTWRGWCSRCGPASPSSASSPRSGTSRRAPGRSPGTAGKAFWVFFYALATWGNAGFLREQVCKYMCPYARFQSAMFDRNTLIIAYDPMRGEPRGPRKRGLASVLERARGLLDQRHRLRLRVPRQPPPQRGGRSGRTPRHDQLATLAWKPRRCRSSRPRNWATASTAPCACRCARSASTSATACSTSASPAARASTPATT